MAYALQNDDSSLNQESEMAEVIEINRIEELEPYRLAWTALLPKTPRASFFHSFDWFKTFWKHFGHNRHMRVLIIRSLDKTIGIVPLVVQTERFQVGEVRVLTYPLSDWGTWYGPIGPDQTASLLMAFEHLQQTPRDWDMLDLRWVDAAAGQLSKVDQTMQLAGWEPTQSPYQHTSVIEFADSDWETYLGNLNKKWRHEVRRQNRVVERDYQIEFERYRPAGSAAGEDDPRWDLFDECLQISRQSWQGDSTTGNTLCHEHVRDFLRECHTLAAEQGMVDVAVLRLNGEPAAFQYNYINEGRLFGLRMGFDRKFTKQGVGKVLMSRLVEDSFDRGDVSLDMGIGDFDFKRRFRTKVETSYQYSCYPWSAWRSQGVRLTRWVKERFKPQSEPISTKVN